MYFRWDIFGLFVSMLNVIILLSTDYRCMKETYSLNLEDKVCKKCKIGGSCFGGT